MERLILMRHGKAERHAQSGGDFERALADSGRVDASLVGRVLAGLAYAPDLILVSSARRTRETAAQVAEHFPKARVEPLRDLYHADPEEILQALEDSAEGADTVMVVGHNPGMHDLALRLAMGAGASPIQMNKLRSRFPTSTVVALAWDGRQAPRLEHLLFASEHGGMGGE